MPLLKLWNSIRGRSAKVQADDQDFQNDASANTKRPNRSNRFSLFGGGPHAGLCKLVKSVKANTVLEISVGDGSRALAVMEAVEKGNENVQYVAIDQFEMAGGTVTLKQFHQSLRANGIRPQLFPETVQRGLIRVAHTIGTVDLVLIGTPVETWQTAEVLALLSRVLHDQTLVLYQGDEETWVKYAVTTPPSRVAA